MITRVVNKANYEVTLFYTDTTGAEKSQAMSFTSVSGGEIEWNTADEHIDTRHIFTSKSVGRASVKDLTLEKGLFLVPALADPKNIEQINLSQAEFYNILKVCQGNQFKIDLDVKKIMLTDQPLSPNRVKIVEVSHFFGCVIKSVHFGDMNSTSEELVIQKLVVAPSGLEVEQDNGSIKTDFEAK